MNRLLKYLCVFLLVISTAVTSGCDDTGKKYDAAKNEVSVMIDKCLKLPYDFSSEDALDKSVAEHDSQKEEIDKKFADMAPLAEGNSDRKQDFNDFKSDFEQKYAQKDKDAKVSFEMKKQKEQEKKKEEFIGNKKTKKYHRPNCRAVARIKDRNIIILHSTEEAVGKNYIPCGICLP